MKKASFYPCFNGIRVGTSEQKEQITKKVLKVTISGIISHCKFEYKVGD